MNPDARRHWGHAATIATLSTAFLFAYGSVPKVNDEHLYLPISRAIADPGLYPASDLVVSSGLRGPFFVYRLASVLYSAGISVDAWWLGAYAVSLVALFAALWWLARTISGSSLVAAGVTALIAAASPYRGTVHWFLLPPPNLVISTLASPPLIAAFALAIGGRRGPALILASLTFNLHPSMGLITAACIGLLMLLDVPTVGWRPTLKWFAVALVCAMPTALFIARSTPANFAAPDPAMFRLVFRTYSWHVFPLDHWREGYGLFLLGLGAVALLARRNGPQRHAAVCVAFMVAIMLAYVANLFTVDLIAIDLLFLFRAAGFVKVLVWIVAAAALAERWAGATGESRRWIVATAIAWVIAALSKNADIGEGFAAIGCAIASVAFGAGPRVMRAAVAAALVVGGTLEILGQGWGFLHVAPFSTGLATNVKVATIDIAVAWLAITLVWRWQASGDQIDSSAFQAPAPAQLSLSAALAVTLFATALALTGHVAAFRPASPARVAARAAIATPDPAVRDVIAWAGTTPRGSLIAVPPLDDRFSTLRLAAGRGLYIQASEVIQVAYDVSAAAEAHRRVLALGTRIIAPHDFSDTAYGTLSADSVAALARDGVQFAVFPKAARATTPLNYPVAYTDSLWTVLDLRPR